MATGLIKILTAVVELQAEMIERLQAELALNAKLLATQTDLAREAETKFFALSRGNLEVQQETRTPTADG